MHYWRGNAGRGGRDGRGNAGSLTIALSALLANSSLKLLYLVEKDFNPALLHCEVILELELLVLQFEEVLLVLPILLLPLSKDFDGVALNDKKKLFHIILALLGLVDGYLHDVGTASAGLAHFVGSAGHRVGHVGVGLRINFGSGPLGFFSNK